MLSEATVPGRERGNPADFAGQPFVGLEHVEAHTTTLLGYVPAETMRSSGVRFATGDVLYARMRPYLNKVWLADRDGLCSGEFIVFPSTGALRGGFLKYRLNAQDFVTFSDHATSGDRPRADFADFGKFPVLVPPLAEQERIADRIDELFTDLSAGVAALERVKRNLSRYRAAVLHAAVTGRLTEAWRKEHGPTDESGPKLLERILAERRRQWEQRTLAKYEQNGKKPPKNWKSRYPEPNRPKPLPDGTPLPALPRYWCWATHDQVGDVQLGRQRSPQHHHGKHMRPYLRVANVYEDRIDTSGVLEMNFTPDEYEVYALQYGDVLLNEGQSMELVGRPAMYRDELPGGCFQNTLVRQRPFEGILPEFALAVCRAQFRAGRFRQIASITTSIAHLGAQRFAAIEFPLPPEKEQAVIVETVQEKLSQIDALEAEVERGLKRSGRMRQAILKMAFEGKLVPQDPNDEPADVLLERIRAETTAAETKPSRPKNKRRKKKSSRKTTVQ
jgi:type I restriction enzyme S subunit